MPFRTKSGSHYHMTEGCHGADIPCDTSGLAPCSTCCGGGGEPGGTGPASSPGTAPGASAQGDHGQAVVTPAPASAAPSRLDAISGAVEAGQQAMAEGMPAPEGEAISPSDLPKGPPIEGLDYEGRGKGWPVRKRGARYYSPGGNGYAYLTRKQAGIVYGAIKRGSVSLDKRHVKAMYDIVGTPWGSLDVHDRQVLMHIDAAIDHILADQYDLAQAELDGHYTELSQRVVGTRKVTVTDDNWIDFAFDPEHDYEVGDIAEEDVIEEFWVVKDSHWD